MTVCEACIAAKLSTVNPFEAELLKFESSNVLLSCFFEILED